MRLHEAREIAGGASGRNGGFALRGGAPAYDVARRELGAERARAFWVLTERYARPARAARRRRVPAHRQPAPGRGRRRAGRARGRVRGAARGRLRGRVARRAPGAAWPGGSRARSSIRRDGALQPARWVRRLAALRRRGGRRAPRARAGRIARRARRRPGRGRDRRLHDGLAAGARRRDQADPRPGARHRAARAAPVRPARTTPGTATTTGSSCRTAGSWPAASATRPLDNEYTADEATTPLIQGRLERFVAELLGDAPRIDHRWAGIFGHDRRPPAARRARCPGRRARLGRGRLLGHGNVLGLACGELVAGAILGAPAPELELFDPARLLGR